MFEADFLGGSLESCQAGPEMIHQLCRAVGFPATAGGVFTAGGWQPLILGLRLARDAYLSSRLQWSAAKWGLPPEARELRVLAAETAQLTAEEAAAEIGLGAHSVVPVAVDDELRLCPEALTDTLQRLEAQELQPVAVIAGAGTFGAIDPLAEIARIARRWGAWLHVDAGHGGALLFSDRHRARLQGIDAADSLGLGFCEPLWQTAPGGVFLLRDAAGLALLDPNADAVDLARRRAPTSGPSPTGHPEALKTRVGRPVLDRDHLGAMVDRLLELAQEATRLIRENPRLELANRPTSGCLVFRYRPEDPAVDADGVNAALPDHLRAIEAASIGAARVRSRSYLQLRFLDPHADPARVADLLGWITDCGRALERAPTSPL